MPDHELLIAQHTAKQVLRVWDDTLRRFRPPISFDNPMNVRQVTGVIVVDLTGPWAQYKVWVRSLPSMANILSLPPGRVLLDVEDEKFQRIHVSSAPYQPGDTKLLANPKIDGMARHMTKFIQHGTPLEYRFKGVKSR